jgi:uncharacterized protein (DUF433 family)
MLQDPEDPTMNTPNGKQWKWLYHDPLSSYKQLSIKGTRIKARTIYGQSVGEGAFTPEELAEDFGVPLEAVREAIEYVESDPPEIREDWEMEERLIREAEDRNDPNFWGPKRIAARLKELGMESKED